MSHTESQSTANNSSHTLPLAHETGFQRFLQETESQLFKEVDELFQAGGVAMPAKVFSDLLSELTEHLGISLTEFYRNQTIESKNLQANIEMLLAVEDAKRLHIEELKRQELVVKKLKQQKESELKESISYLEEEKQEVYEKVRDMYDRKDEAREKFLNMHEYTQQKE
jgi:hypothetical protein